MCHVNMVKTILFEKGITKPVVTIDYTLENYNNQESNAWGDTPDVEVGVYCLLRWLKKYQPL